MHSFAALAPLALMASASLVDALPSPVRIEGVVPSVTNADGSVNDELLKANMEATFAKYEDLAERSTDSSSKAGSLKVRRRDGKAKCKRATTKTIPVDYEGNLGLVSCSPSFPRLFVSDRAAPSQYNIEIGVGTPAQNLRALVSTGSLHCTLLTLFPFQPSSSTLVRPTWSSSRLATRPTSTTSRSVRRCFFLASRAPLTPVVSQAPPSSTRASRQPLPAPA